MNVSVLLKSWKCGREVVVGKLRMLFCVVEIWNNKSNGKFTQQSQSEETAIPNHTPISKVLDVLPYVLNEFLHGVIYTYIRIAFRHTATGLDAHGISA